VVADAAGCRDEIAATQSRSMLSLDSSDIRLFVWNMRKGIDPASMVDLTRLAHDSDIVLIQEASIAMRPGLSRARYSSFAAGYRTATKQTGVMTLSGAQPLALCVLTDREPWLRTPKATGVAVFGIDGTDETLAVVNVHGINFTLGVEEQRQQLAKIGLVLSRHRGPVIVAGDFNTWRAGRLAVVEDWANSLALEELSFADDHRVTPLGLAVDRVFARGLRPVESSTAEVDSSDHNPMLVRFQR
jgi:endonuclease/exonuclease/phosphatase (EEP) superfamily protein YafD